MTALDCNNPFNINNHDDLNISPLKRVSPLIQLHASSFGAQLEIGARICDKCRLYARHKYGLKYGHRKRKSKMKGKLNKSNTLSMGITHQSNISYAKPMSDSSDRNDSSNEPYSEKYHKQRVALMENSDKVGDQITEYEDDSTPKDETSTNTNVTNDNSNQLTTIATSNPVSEFKIVAVTSLPAEKHNEIMNNDDNAMNAMDSIYNHQDKINEIISSASNSSVFGIAKKSDSIADPEYSFLTASTSKPHRQIASHSLKKTNSKVKNLKEKLQKNYRLQNVHIQKFDDISTTNKTSTDSDENSSYFNSKFSRRKDTLQPLDCEMEFVEVSSLNSKKQSHMTNEQKILSAQLETVKTIRNPNADLLRKVAFLRVCVNYMMTELEGEPFHFGKNITYENLKTKYNSKRLS